jgi:hypothetical protein
MDPNANLKEQRELASKILNEGPFSTDDYEAMTNRLAELVEALDGWLSNKGFLPGRWSR